MHSWLFFNVVLEYVGEQEGGDEKYYTTNSMTLTDKI